MEVRMFVLYLCILLFGACLAYEAKQERSPRTFWTSVILTIFWLVLAIRSENVGWGFYKEPVPLYIRLFLEPFVGLLWLTFDKVIYGLAFISAIIFFVANHRDHRAVR